MTNTPQNPSVDFGFHAVIPRVIRTAYKHLTPVQKWLYVCLKDLCGDHGTCYRSLRALSEETDLSTGMLSESIADLHKAGLIHAEKKKRSTGGKEVWHITIVDIWQANGVAHPTKRSHSEPECSAGEQTLENVHTVNQNVQQVNKECSAGEPECSLCETEVITEKQEQNKAIPLKQESDGAASADTPAHSQTQDTEKNVTQANGETDGYANRDRDTLPARIDPDPVQSLRDPQSALRDQNGAAPAQQQRNETRPGNDTRTPRRRTTGAVAVVLSEQEQAFYDLYCSMPWIKVAPEITDKVKEQCGKLAPHLKTQEDLYSLRKFMNGRDFFKGKFSLALVALALNDFAMTQVDTEVPRKSEPQARVSDEERLAKRAAAEEKKAALLAPLHATTNAYSERQRRFAELQAQEDARTARWIAGTDQASRAQQAMGGVR